MLLFFELSDKLTEELATNRHSYGFNLIHKLPLVAGKYTSLIFKEHLGKQVVSLIIVVPLRLEVKLTVTHRKPRKLSRRSMETYLLPIIEYHMRPTHIDAVS